MQWLQDLSSFVPNGLNFVKFDRRRPSFWAGVIRGTFRGISAPGPFLGGGQGGTLAGPAD